MTDPDNALRKHKELRNKLELLFLERDEAIRECTKAKQRVKQLEKEKDDTSHWLMERRHWLSKLEDAQADLAIAQENIAIARQDKKDLEKDYPWL